MRLSIAGAAWPRDASSQSIWDGHRRQQLGEESSFEVNVLVTGGNGLLGRHLLPELQARGGNVRVLALAEEDTSWLKEQNVEVYVGDVRDPSTLKSPMRGVDTVFHLAGMIGLWRSLDDYHSVNVQGTENIALAALEAGVRRMVHVSSWTVYGMGLREPAREDAPHRPFAEPYGVTKARSEKVIRRLVSSRGLPAVIVRPDTFFGPGDRLHYTRLADRLKAGKGLVIGSGSNTLPFVYVSDAARGLILASQAREAKGQAYNIASDHPFTQEQMLDAIAEAVGAPAPRLHVPFHLMYGGAAFVEMMSSVLIPTRQPLVTRLGVLVFGANNPHSIEKAQLELGYQPTVPIAEGIKMTAAWYSGQPVEGQARTGLKAVETKA